MPKRPTARPPVEHHAIIGRIYRQVGLDRKMQEPRRKKILKLLEQVLSEFQAEIGT